MTPEFQPTLNIPLSDHRRLADVAARAATDLHPVAGFLLGELKRANVVPANKMPDNIVTLDGWVTYRLDWGWAPESRRLVCPEDYRSADIHLSVLSPLGAALIGMGVGSRISYSSIEGVPHVASVECLDAAIGVHDSTITRESCTREL